MCHRSKCWSAWSWNLFKNSVTMATGQVTLGSLSTRRISGNFGHFRILKNYSCSSWCPLSIKTQTNEKNMVKWRKNGRDDHKSFKDVKVNGRICRNGRAEFQRRPRWPWQLKVRQWNRRAMDAQLFRQSLTQGQGRRVGPIVAALGPMSSAKEDGLGLVSVD